MTLAHWVRPLVLAAVLAAAPAAVEAGTPGDHGDEGTSGLENTLKEMVGSEELSAGIILGALALALLAGAAHGLEPGHGKTIVAAYLVGSRGTVSHAMFLGGVVTFTHTFSILLLGLMALFATQWIDYKEIMPWMGTASGLLIVALGGWLLVNQLRGPGHGHHHHHHGDHDHGGGHDHGDHHHGDHDHGDHEHGHGEGHHHGHGHSHEIPAKVTLGSLLTLGISGGIVPCPGALVILLLAVGLDRIAFGLVLLVVFSFGLAAVLIAVGVLFVKARPLVERFSGDGKWIQRLPMASAAFIIFVGFAITLKTLTDMGVLDIHL